MMKTIEELVENMNDRIYRIHIDVLMKNLNKYKAQKDLLTHIFMEAYGIEFKDEDNYLALRQYIGSMEKELDGIADIIKRLKHRITIDGLGKSFESTGREIFKITQKYVTAVKKYEAYMNLYKQLELRESLENEITMVKRVIFAVSNSDKKAICIENPTFNAFSIEEIKELFGFWNYVKYDDVDSVIRFVNKNEAVFQRGYSSNYFVKGNVVYYTIYPSELNA
ncbi:hypothetical protein [Clostridium sp. C2-6-12]|uniref:hypothetical protein n=1 Tax=Clostridium sp. C2-6-12 TaxID=2698832 RepID=UPI00136AFB0F|nr:hypothetical protein [Clostridium sp. C2-6-12]